VVQLARDTGVGDSQWPVTRRRGRGTGLASKRGRAGQPKEHLEGGDRVAYESAFGKKRSGAARR